MKARHIYIIGMAALTLTGCVKDELFDTPHPGKGRITVTADWNARGEGIATPESWNLSMGDYHGTETAATHAPDHLFEPGCYSLVAWNPATDISVSGTSASVTSTADGCISGDPGWLFTSVQEVTIEADRDHAFTATMQQQVRQLTLTIRLTGDAAERVEGISGRLSGVAGTMDFASDTYGAPSSVALNFTKITQGENAGAWTATVRLLGITGESQQLTGGITYAGDNLPSTPVASDMTALLAGFNDNKTVPLSLACDLETPTQAGVTATIIDWEVQEEVNADIK
jgi:hypothetical protein